MNLKRKHENSAPEMKYIDFKSSSPHTIQNKECYYYSGKFDRTCRIIHEKTARQPYQRRSNQDKSTIHFGQRKLLLSEIEFLTIVTNELHSMNTNKKVVFIYAGAAPGNHTPMIIEMFPFIDLFVLVDPAKFKFSEKKVKDKVKIYNECFTNKMAEDFRQEYKDCHILFVSDIRTANHRILTAETTELKIEKDMIDQMEWYKTLKPFKSMFKFRLPYVGDNQHAKTQLEYLDGVSYFQAWEGKTSSETRLIVDQNADMKLYDCVQYEDIMYRFNTVERVICYKHDIDAPGLDHCYDCRTEVYILEEFLNSKSKIFDLHRLIYDRKPYLTSETLKKKNIKELVIEINRLLNAERKTDGMKITINGKQKLYSIIFTDVYYKCDLAKLFSDEKIVERKFFRYNSSDDEDDVEERKSSCMSLHCLESKYSEYIEKEFASLRYLTQDFRQKIKPKEKYEFTDKTTVDFKERGLRLLEIEFLTASIKEIVNCKKRKELVCIYAGFGPSSKSFQYLVDMFPFIKFVLYDPKPDFKKTSTKVDFKKECLSESIAQDLKNQYQDFIILFISNIKRAGNFISEKNTLLEKEDLQIQKSCFQILDPFKSLLRFRVPYPESKLKTKVDFSYLNGYLKFQPWSNRNSLDVFLICDKNAMDTTYNYIKLKNQLYKFNTIDRVMMYKHLIRIDGIDECYDCRCEVFIFDEYLKQANLLFNYYRMKPSEKSTSDLIEDMNNYLKASDKYLKMQFDKKDYRIKFTSIKHGLGFHQVFKN
ncbi:unnamed protein product [Brachionus calyciflorus]|uniref:Cap-specific mRNA (nucleoside-2'-O-)-methyltransferase n=1 Tax=Brachionus calyciflorus TaxID=104777 RepID=A0A814GBK1_9BILA|nr:unnamed protein product [Brachionus calyciflorus]